MRFIHSCIHAALSYILTFHISDLRRHFLSAECVCFAGFVVATRVIHYVIPMCAPNSTLSPPSLSQLSPLYSSTYIRKYSPVRAKFLVTCKFVCNGLWFE